MGECHPLKRRPPPKELSPIAFTTPATAVSGTVLTASHLNTYVRDNVAWIATDSPSCRAYKSGTQSISDNTATSVTYDSERYDNASMHSTSSSTDRITVPSGAGGKYLFGTYVSWAADVDGYREVLILQNGATTVGKDHRSVPGSGGNSAVTVTSAYALAAADYISVTVQHTAGNALNVASSEFWAFWFRT